MTKSILRTIVIGILIGATAYFMPHLLLGMFLFFALLRAFMCCGRGHCGSHRRGGRFQMMDKIRSMSDEEYVEFKNNHGLGCCHSKQKCETDSKCCSDTKTTETTK
ncbi:MAG: hypothetical protein WCJ61_03835 [Paludibacter sp.]